MNLFLIFAGAEAIGTVGAFGYLIKETKTNRKISEAIFWHEHYPVLSLVSASCDITQNLCMTDLMNNISEYDERGNKLFGVVNDSNSVAYKSVVEFAKDPEISNEVKKHFIGDIGITQKPVYEESIEQQVAIIYSKYHVIPETKVVSYEEFDICKYVENCPVSEGDNCKLLYVRLTYYTSPDVKHAKKSETIYKVCLRCSKPTIQINYIVGISHDTEN